MGWLSAGKTSYEIGSEIKFAVRINKRQDLIEETDNAQWSCDGYAVLLLSPLHLSGTGHSLSILDV